MIGTEFAEYIRQKTKTNTTTFPNAEIVVYANAVKTALALHVAKESEGNDLFGQIYYANLVANRREYPLPDAKIFRLQGVEAKLDGTNWQKLEETDPKLHYDFVSDDASIKARYAGYKPAYHLFRGSIWILSGNDITSMDDGLKLWCQILPADITTTTLTSSDDLGDDPTATSFGMPFQLHKLWADAIIAEWKEENGRDLTQNELTIKQFLDISNTISALNGFNADRKIIVGMRESEWGQGFGDRWSQDNPLNL